MAHCNVRLRTSVRRGGLQAVTAAALLILVGCQSPEERAQAHLKRGNELVQQGESAKANLEFRNALKLNERLTPALYALGQIEQAAGRPDRAASMYRRVIEQDLQHVRSRVDLGSLILVGGPLDEAVKLADQALALAPSDAGVLSLKAAVSLKLGNSLEAVQFAESALQMDPGAMNAVNVLIAERLRAGDPRGALEKANRGLASKNALEIELSRLQVLEILKDHAEIEKTLAKLTEAYPQKPEIRLTFIRWYLKAGRHADAERVLRKFVSEDPKNLELGLALAELIRRERGPAAAKAELQGLVSANPSIVAYRRALARLLYSTGEQTEAIALNRTLSKESQDEAERAGVTIDLARMLLATKQSKEAEGLMDTLLSKDKRNVDALTVRATVRSLDGRVAEAVDDLRAALNESPESLQILLQMAEVHERSGAVELAEESLAKAVRLGQYSPDAALPYARFLLRYGKIAQAERVLAEARAKAPSHRQIISAHAQILLQRQDWVGAQEAADTLRKISSDDGIADQIQAMALGGQGKFNQSIELLQDAANSDVRSMTALVEMHVAAKQVDRAEQFLRTVLKGNEANAAANALLGWVLAIKGDLDAAEAASKRAIEQAPKESLGYKILANLYASQRRYKDAGDVLRAGLSQPEAGGGSALRLQLASVLESAREYEAAIAEYEKLLAADPQSTIVANNLASLLSEHRSDGASLERAYALASKLSTSRIPQFLDTVGWILYRKGEYARALTPLKAAADGLPNIAVVHYRLGLTYKQLNQSELALAAFEQALGARPDPGLRQSLDREVEQLAQRKNGAERKS